MEKGTSTFKNSLENTNFILAGAHRSRTYRRHRRVPTNGFEVRGVHRGPSAPINYKGYTWFSNSAIHFLDDYII